MSFDHEYEVCLANTQEGREIHYQLRYQVYCEERGWENGEQFPNNQEQDTWDSRSIHFIARHRKTGKWVAGLRLVIGTASQLPFFGACKDNGIELGPEHAKQTSKVAEFSRLHVISGHRAGSIMLGLIRAARDYSILHGYKSWYFIIAKPLARILNKVGCDFDSLGPELNHHGVRLPFHADITTGFDNMEFVNPAAHAMFRKTAYSKNPGYALFSELQPERVSRRNHLPSLGNIQLNRSQSTAFA